MAGSEGEPLFFNYLRDMLGGHPLTSYAVIVQLIGSTKTATGLQIRAEWDENTYPTKETVTTAQMANVRLTPATLHGEWNYAIAPH